MEPNAGDGTSDTLVGAAEAAEILAIGRSAVNKFAATGVLKTAVKMPGRTGARLFTTAELERFRAENFHPATAPAYEDVTP
jgi:hypothetical protein